MAARGELGQPIAVVAAVAVAAPAARNGLLRPRSHHDVGAGNNCLAMSQNTEGSGVAVNEKQVGCEMGGCWDRTYSRGAKSI